MRQESISLTQDHNSTWSNVLPRTDLKNRFVIIERRNNTSSLKHIVADCQKVRQWLIFLFENHSDFIKMKENNEIELSEEAMASLNCNQELAEVYHDPETIDDEEEEGIDQQVHQAEMSSGLSRHDVFSFDSYPKLYLSDSEVLKVKKTGEIQIVKDISRHVPIYSASSKVAFPHLYFDSDKGPLDFGDYRLAKFLLKKQCMYAFKLLDGRYIWPYQSDDIHMMHSYGRWEWQIDSIFYN